MFTPPTQLLLTSFATWLPHQPSNSSADLLQALHDRWQRGEGTPPQTYRMLHSLPVETEQAFTQIRQAIHADHPQLVICCGMAENRPHFSLEWQAHRENKVLRTGLDLTRIVSNLPRVSLSENAGNFVCNAVYFDVLNLLRSFPDLDHYLDRPAPQALFIHVPILKSSPHLPLDRTWIEDFEAILLSILPSG